MFFQVRLSKEDMKKLLQGATAISAESSESDTAAPAESTTHNQQRGLRGSNVRRGQESDDSDAEAGQDVPEDADPDKRYDLDKYDEDEGKPAIRFLQLIRKRIRSGFQKHLPTNI